MKRKIMVLCLLAGMLLPWGGCAAQQESVTFRAVILELGDGYALVAPVEGEDILRSADRISFGTDGLEDIGATVGDMVRITHSGLVRESYPAQIDVQSWALDDAESHLETRELG